MFQTVSHPHCVSWWRQRIFTRENWRCEHAESISLSDIQKSLNEIKGILDAEHNSFSISTTNKSKVSLLCDQIAVDPHPDVVEVPDDLPCADIPLDQFKWTDEGEVKHAREYTAHIEELLGDALTTHVFEVVSTAGSAHQDLLSTSEGQVKVKGTTDVFVALKRYVQAGSADTGLCICFELKKESISQAGESFLCSDNYYV